MLFTPSTANPTACQVKSVRFSDMSDYRTLRHTYAAFDTTTQRGALDTSDLHYSDFLAGFPRGKRSGLSDYEAARIGRGSGSTLPRGRVLSASFPSHPRLALARPGVWWPSDRLCWLCSTEPLSTPTDFEGPKQRRLPAPTTLSAADFQARPGTVGSTRNPFPPFLFSVVLRSLLLLHSRRKV